MKLYDYYILLISLIFSVADANPHKTVFKRKANDLSQRNLEHVLSIKNFTCRIPQPRIVPIEDFHTVSSQLLYIPHATVLHRCDRETGCCADSSSTCQPIEQQEVFLAFHVLDIDTKVKTTTTLIAYNHTLCGCDNFRVLPG